MGMSCCWCESQVTRRNINQYKISSHIQFYRPSLWLCEMARFIICGNIWFGPSPNGAWFPCSIFFFNNLFFCGRCHSYMYHAPWCFTFYPRSFFFTWMKMKRAALIRFYLWLFDIFLCLADLFLHTSYGWIGFLIVVAFLWYKV